MKISQCMIVKNEEANIIRALTWGKGIVAEQIVVDTGSTDQTVRLAREMGAAVYTYPWNHDFSAAKNYALEQASGDWIAFLDADEYFTEEDAKKLPYLLNILENTKFQDNDNLVFSNTAAANLLQVEADGSIGAISRQIRLFLNHKSIRYQGIIHEELTGLNGFRIYTADLSGELSIYHTGYAWTEEKRQEKGARNSRLLKKMLEQQPDNAKSMLYMAEALCIRHQDEEALSYAMAASQNPDQSLSSERLRTAWQVILYCLYNLREKKPDILDEMENAYKTAASLYPDYPDFDIAMGFYHYAYANWDNTILYLDRALEKSSCMPAHSDSLFLASLTAIYIRLAVACKQKQLWKQFIHYATQSLSMDKYQPAILQMLFEAFETELLIPHQEILLYLQKIYDLTLTKDLLTILKGVKSSQSKALEQTLANLLPREQQQALYPGNPENIISDFEITTETDREFLAVIAMLKKQPEQDIRNKMLSSLKAELKHTAGCPALLQALGGSLEQAEKSIRSFIKERQEESEEMLQFYMSLSDYKSKRVFLASEKYKISFQKSFLLPTISTLLIPDPSIKESNSPMLILPMEGKNIWKTAAQIHTPGSLRRLYLRNYGSQEYPCQLVLILA